MTKLFQWRRGTTAQHAPFVGALGEITVDTDKDTLVVHDGITPGGFPMVTEISLNNITITGGSITGITNLAIADGGTGASTASGARINLGLGTIATQDADAVSITGGSITGMPNPTSAQDVATKFYVDSLSAGLDLKESVRLATVSGDLSTFTFTNNGGVGDTLTAPGPGFTSVDGTNLADENRVLVKDQADAKENGIYIASNTGSGGTTVLTRATDQDGSPTNEVSAGNFTFVETGSINDSTGWVVIGDGIITVNVGDIDWAKFSDVSGALVDIIGDTTPQLGGDLDVNNFSIISVSNGDIAITPDGSGTIILDGLSWPIADGTNGQVLTTDGAGNLSFTTVAGGGLNNIVEDTTPQLGGQLDVNTFGLGDGVNLLLGFVEDASAVNYIEIENEESGSGPVLRATGTDPNVDLILQPKGIGDVIVGLGGPSEIRGDTNENLTVGGGDSDATAVGGNTVITSGDGSGVFDSGSIFITPGTGGTGDGDLILNGLTWPTADGSAGQFLKTDGAGNLSFASGGDPDQNLWETFNADSGTTVANSLTDTLTVTGGTSITTGISGDTLTITNDDPNIVQNVYLTIDADSGSPTSASSASDTLNIVGGTGITTGISGDTVTISPVSNSPLQIIYGQTTTPVASSSTTYVSTTLSASITPLSATSTVLIQVVIVINDVGFTETVQGRLVRDAAPVFETSEGFGGTIPVTFLDTPATTSAITYTVEFRRGLLGAEASAVTAQPGGALSTIVLTEINA